MSRVLCCVAVLLAALPSGAEEPSVLTELEAIHRALLEDNLTVAKLATRLGPIERAEGEAAVILTPTARWLTRVRVSRLEDGSIYTVALDFREAQRPTLGQLARVFGEGKDARGLHGERDQMFYPKARGPRWSAAIIASLSPCRDPHTTEEWTGGPCAPMTPDSRIVQLTFRRDRL